MKSTHSVHLLGAALLVAAVCLPVAADEQRSKAPGRTLPTGQAERKIDLNTADQKTLEAVPEIGADGAKAIMAARPFASIDELDRLKGVSAERLEQIRAKTMVSPPVVKTKLGEPTREKTPLGSPEPARASPTGKVDINTADIQTLEAMPSISPDLARAIVAARPFTSLDDLSRVKGMTAEQLEQVRTELTLGTGQDSGKKKQRKGKSPKER